ncbi:SGNH/GDSL hydrolase family protein [Luteolibacter flavescens]|uniref:SGNH/GDSL hydrolase family protein n=1 Tax=Luteolibacter flavescens TaxID=1859460 RepID=A0ABT3FWA2_9BACT|nr:SGNH/GDSL hydrolase family protein [Luteolibacter flavescens]MCW1887511.1 SGNH/GDSL hydrolase family protein [Luteolibacter flavescens]
MSHPLKAWTAALSLSLALAGSAAAEEPAPAYVPRAPLAKLDLHDGDTIVFLGDSITHQCLYTQYVEDYFYTRFPRMRLRLHNAGVGGSRAWDALHRFDRDVAAYQPKYVTVLLGMNDGRYAEYLDDVFTGYSTEMDRLLEKIDACGATAVLMTPTMFDARAKRMQPPGGFMGPKAVTFYNSTLAYYGAWLRDTASERGLGFVDMWGPLNETTLRERRKDPAFTLIKDSVHPDAPGQVVMAAAMIGDLGLPRIVSEMKFSLQEEQWTSTAEAAEITGLEGTADGLSFTSLERALPWVLPADAQPGVRLTDLGGEFGRQTLTVSGLPAGTYTVSIDGAEVTRATREELQTGLPLHDLAKTPQYQQAAHVAELNKQRNEGPVKTLRNEWVNFQQVKFLQSQVEKNPADEAEKQRLADAEKKLPGMEERVKAAEAAARAIEDDIFKNNQPRPHRFEIRPVGK